MRRRRFLAACALTWGLGAGPGCRRPAAPRPLTDALLGLAREQLADLPFDERAAEAELALLTRRARAALEHGDLVAALREAVFTQSAFAREIDDSDLRFVLLPAVLADRKGSCVGLGTLYLVLAELLGRPELEGVMVPGHFFVRSGGRNVELLRQGEVMPDRFYRERYGDRRAPAHGRGLTSAEIVAVVRFNIGNERRRQGRLPEAAAAYAAAAQAFPQFAEAHASLGLALQLQGRLAEARAAYLAARAADPTLPGLGSNLQQVEAQLPTR